MDTLGAPDHLLFRNAPPVVAAGGRDARQLGGLHPPDRHRGHHEAGDAPADGRLHQLSEPGHAGEDRRQRGRGQQRPIVARSGRRLARAGVRGIRLPLRPARQPLRGSAPDHRAAAEGRDGHLSRPVLRGRRLRADAARPAKAGAADLDRRPPATNARAGGEVCRCLPHRPVARRDDTKAAEDLFKIVDDACRKIGRDPSTLLRTSGCSLAVEGADEVEGGVPAVAIRGSKDEIVEKLAAYAAVGVTHFTFWLTADPEVHRATGANRGGRPQAVGALSLYGILTFIVDISAHCQHTGR